MISPELHAQLSAYLAGELDADRQPGVVPVQRHRHGRLAGDVGKRGERRLLHGFADDRIQQAVGE